MTMTNTAENNFLSAKYAGGSLTTVSHLGLTTADPGEAGAFTNEISTSGTNYARAVTGSGLWTVTANAASNNARIDYLTPTADWAAGGTQITHAFAANALTAGTMLDIFTLGTAVNVVSTDGAPYFAAGDLTFTVDPVS